MHCILISNSHSFFFLLTLCECVSIQTISRLNQRHFSMWFKQKRKQMRASARAFATISNCWLRNKIKRISRWKRLTAADNTKNNNNSNNKKSSTNLSHRSKKSMRHRIHEKKEALQLFLISFLYFVNAGFTFSFTIFVAIFDWNVHSLCPSFSLSLSVCVPVCIAFSFFFITFWKFD